VVTLTEQEVRAVAAQADAATTQASVAPEALQADIKPWVVDTRNESGTAWVAYSRMDGIGSGRRPKRRSGHGARTGHADDLGRRPASNWALGLRRNDQRSCTPPGETMRAIFKFPSGSHQVEPGGDPNARALTRPGRHLTRFTRAAAFARAPP
jgi:hypothetical protein